MARVLALALLLGGCSGLADTVKALSQDPATVCYNMVLSTPWGTQHLNGSRTNLTVGSVTCTADGGMNVQPTGGGMVTVPVGVQVVPVK